MMRLIPVREDLFTISFYTTFRRRACLSLIIFESVHPQNDNRRRMESDGSTHQACLAGFLLSRWFPTNGVNYASVLSKNFDNFPA
jgi:hypothetical protein